MFFLTENVTTVTVEHRDGNTNVFTLDSLCSREHVDLLLVDVDPDGICADFVHEDGTTCQGSAARNS